MAQSAKSPSLSSIEGAPWRSPLDQKNLARARFKAEPATTEQLARDVAETTRQISLARLQEFRSGRGTPDLLLEALSHAATAEMAFSKTDTQTARLQAIQWMHSWQAYVINRGRFEDRKIALADYAETRRALMEAEQAWKDKSRLDGSITAWARDLDYATLRQLAQARFQVSQHRPEEIAPTLREAAREEVAARLGDFRAGRGGLHDLLLKACEHAGEAERALSKDPTALAKAWAYEWSRLWLIETVDRARHEAGKISLADLSQSRYARLDSERRWSDKSRLIGTLPLGASGADDGVLGRKELARARYNAAQRRPELATREELEAARVMLRERLKEFIAGRGTLSLFLNSNRSLLTIELIQASDKAARLQALEGHWRRLFEAETINQARHEAGRISIADLLETRLVRQEAEMALLREKQQHQRK
jgi:hypothetical protein